jgi:hypothetical protein
MINIGGNPLMIILAIVAALGGVGLYFVRNFRPELARDHDIFFSAIALVYGIILLAFNFRMEITTQLAQVLVVGFAGWFAVESLVLRQALASQARRSSPPNPVMDMMDDDPIGSDYRVEIDPSREISARQRNTRRMRGSAPTDSNTELRGDVDRENRTKRSKRNNDPVIDIDEDDIRPVNPKRRPRQSSDGKNDRGGRDRNVGGESDDQQRGSASSRRRRPTSRPSSSTSDVEVNDFDDF